MVFKNQSCCALLNRFSLVQLFAILRTVAHQAPLSMGILQARILEWTANLRLVFNLIKSLIKSKSSTTKTILLELQCLSGGNAHTC